jgi:hypothetical protein
MIVQNLVFVVDVFMLRTSTQDFLKDLKIYIELWGIELKPHGEF